MKWIILLLAIATGCRSLVAPPDIVIITVNFESPQPPRVFTSQPIAVKIEEDGVLKAEYALAYPANQRFPIISETFQSSRDTRIKVSALFPNNPVPTVYEFVVSEYTGARSYMVDYDERADNTFASSCITPTQVCPTVP